jgi:SAM-dependent methyltransferase
MSDAASDQREPGGLLRRLLRPPVRMFFRSYARAKTQALASIKPAAELLVNIEASLSARWAATAHRRLMYVQWRMPPTPEHFDHTIDLYYMWRETRKSYWVERGVFSGLALKGGRVLELACGDGFNARNFYSLRSHEVIACDFDPKAIALAQRKNEAPNVRYVLADIRVSMPDGPFENIVWDAAIEHFTPTEIADILRNIAARLAPGGILSGYTVVERAEGGKMLEHHEYEFKDAEDLRSIITPHFRNVRVFETIYPDRHNLYFWASDDALPLQP